MKHGSNTRRPRGGRNNGRRPNNNSRTKVFDSNGPDVRIRGNAGQVHEKYVALARDAASGGDHILAESYLQHAEHYQRVLNEIQVPKEPQVNTHNPQTEEKTPVAKSVVETKDSSTPQPSMMVKEPEMA